MATIVSTEDRVDPEVAAQMRALGALLILPAAEYESRLLIVVPPAVPRAHAMEIGRLIELLADVVGEPSYRDDPELGITVDLVIQ